MTEPPYVVTEVTSPGTLEGRIVLVGSPPPPGGIEAGGAPGSCGGHKADESLLLDSEGGVAHGVVSLERIAGGKPWPEDPPPVLDQRECIFLPHVLLAPVGSSLEVRNSDPVFHNVHAYTWTGRYSPFNLAMPAGKDPLLQPLEKPGILALRCDAGHRWMSAYIHVGRTPYQVATGADGKFRVTGIPPGKHEVTVWHERFGLHRFPVSIPPSGVTTLDLRALTGPDRLELDVPARHTKR